MRDELGGGITFGEVVVRLASAGELRDLGVGVGQGRGLFFEELATLPEAFRSIGGGGEEGRHLQVRVQRADLAFQASSLDAPRSAGADPGNLADILGEDDPQLRSDLERARAEFTVKMTETQVTLEALWTRWDDAEDADDTAAREAAKTGMVDLLNRRSYLRNLVRDVNEALES